MRFNENETLLLKSKINKLKLVCGFTFPFFYVSVSREDASQTAFASFPLPPFTLPLPLLFMRFTVLALMLVLVKDWFQHIFFVSRLTSQLPQSSPPGAHLGVLFLGFLL